MSPKGQNVHQVTATEIEDHIRCEVSRRKKMLGEELLQLSTYEYRKICNRSKLTGIPTQPLSEWWIGHYEKGDDGLRPNWENITESDLQVALERRKKLGDHIDDEMLSTEVIEQIRESFGLSLTQRNRYIHRYRVGGLIALAPGQYPIEKRIKESTPVPDLGALSDDDLEYIFEQFKIIEPLAMKAKCTDSEVEKRANECGCSPRKVRYLLAAYHKYGLAGLARKERSDKGGVHKIGETMTNIILGLRVTLRDASPRYVLEEACRRAMALGETEPRIGQVRDLINTIPASELLLADGRVGQFRNKYRFTHSINFLKLGIVYQVDATRVPRLVHDLRDKRYANKSGVVRPWLTEAIECASNVIVAKIFTYDYPDRFVMGALLRQAFLKSAEKPFGGGSDEVWVDTAKYFVSPYVKRILRKNNIVLCPHRHHPELEGHSERHFKSTESQLWANGQNYTGPNVVERNPNVKAEGTIADLAAEYDDYLDNKYHVQVNSSLGQSPAGFWYEHIFTESLDPRELDPMLKMIHTRQVLKLGIKYGGRKYWHPLLGDIVGESVRLRIAPSYSAPDEVEVFFNKEWVCTAYADDTEQYDEVSKYVVADAQRQQLQLIRGRINEKRDFLRDVDKSIGLLNPPSKAPTHTAQAKQDAFQEIDDHEDNSPDLYDHYKD